MKVIKYLSALSLVLLVSFGASAQRDKSQRKSPPAQVSKEVNGVSVTIDYSQPSKRGREIFGSLEAYGKVWRTGANETSWIEISDDVKVEGKDLKAGKYGLFTIPGEDQWVIIFNEAWSGWGAYEYNKSADVLRVSVPSTELENVVEVFTIDIDDAGVVSLAWDQTQVKFALK